MKTMKMGLKATVLVFGCLALLSCNPLENKTESSSLLIVEDISGVAADGKVANYLESDVVKLDTTGNAYVTADPAAVTLGAKLLTPSPTLGTSQYNDILVDRYVVRYSRSDGKNREGIDVPYSFEGSLSTLIKIDSTTSLSLLVVRAAAKLEPPLLNLGSGRYEGVLQVTAQIDFYGHDMMNKNVHATGYLAIYFGDYAD